MGIGERLREARIEKGYTIEDIQEKTKIQKRYLNAIEEDNLDALPGKFYAKAFIKEYALIVDLNPDELLTDLQDDPIESYREETVSQSRMERTKRKAADKGTSFLSYLPAFIVVLLVIAIILTAIYFFKEAGNRSDDGGVNSDNEIVRDVNDNNNDNNNENEANDNNENNDDNANNDSNDNNENEADESDDIQFEVETAGEGGVPQSEINVSNVGEQVTLRFEASEDSYIDVADVNDSWLYIDTVPGGSSEEVDVSDHERVLLNIGYTPTMTIYINDVELDYPVSSDEATHQKIWLNFTK
ncbi:MAG TPA: helix-turn-helix domain-containing protein [Pseudogracilibacillus sp.]|nr:helix-turn-helix domain-containing protein [Pseudogracilibacillus sp.]